MQKYLYQHKGQAISKVFLPKKSLQLTIQGQDLFPGKLSVPATS